MLKHSLLRFSLLLLLVSLAACGGGGGSTSGAAGGSALPVQGGTSTALVKIGLSGTLPADSPVAGAMFTLFFPSSLTPVLSNGAVAGNVVTLSGAFAGGILVTPVFTPPTTANALGKLEMTLANTNQAGVTQLGEVASVSLQIASGAAMPTKNNFILSTNGVTDVNGKPLPAVTAIVTEVIVQ